MVRTCQADESLEKQFEALLTGQAGPEVGLLVGRYAAGAKALLYGTVRTPSLEGLDPIQVAGSAAAPSGSSTAPGGAKAGRGKAGGSGSRAGSAAAGGVGSGGLSLTLEAEWITEHARQVARMLPGGLAVLGLYVFCPDAAYIPAAQQLCSLLAGLAAFCLPQTPVASSAPAASEGPPDLLLLHIDASSRKQALRALPAPSTGGPTPPPSSLKPCELRFAPTLSSLVLLRCWHGVDLAAPVADGSGQPLRRQLTALVAAEADRISRGLFTSAEGNLVTDSAPVGEALSPSNTPPAASGSPLGLGLDIPTYDLTLLAPLPCQELGAGAAPPAGSGAQPGEQPVDGRRVVGQARLRGAMAGLAFVHKRDAAGRALAELKADLISSLNARTELLLEEAARVAEEQQQEEQQEHDRQRSGTAGVGSQGGGSTAGGSPAAHPLLQTVTGPAAGGAVDLVLPRRVALPWLAGAGSCVALCDYLMEGEGADAAAERAKELLAQAHTQAVELEQPPSAHRPGASVWRPNVVPGEAVDGGDTARSAASPSGSQLPCSVALLGSLAVGATACALGLLSLSGQLAGGQS